LCFILHLFHTAHNLTPSSVTVKTCLASVYRTHVPGRTHRRSLSWNTSVAIRSGVYYASLLSHNTL